MSTIAPVDTPVAVVLTTRENPLLAAAPATGRTDVTILLADSETGPAIDASVELTAVETSTPGTYLEEFSGDVLRPIFRTRYHQRVWRCVDVNGQRIKADPLTVVETP